MAIIVWLVFFFVNADNIVDNYSKYVYNIGDTAQSGLSIIGDLWMDAIHSDSTNISKNIDYKNLNINKNDEVQKDSYDEFLTVFIIATLFMIVAYFIALIIGIIVFRLKYRKPPLVNAGNVISYY